MAHSSNEDVSEPHASILDQTEPEIPVMGVGEVIEEHVNTWDAEATPTDGEECPL